MKRPKFVIIFIFVTIMGLALWQVGIANEMSTTGAELATIQSQVDNYKRENTVLQEQLLTASSLTTISQEAEKMGYVEASQPISLEAPLPLALK